MSHELNIKYYQDEMFLLNDFGTWVNLNKTYNKQTSVDHYIKGLIRHRIGDGASTRDINEYFNKIMQNTVFHNTVKPNWIDQDIIVFQNGYYDSKGFHAVGPEDVPFSPFQINRPFTEEVKENNKVKDFLWNFASGDKDKYQLFLEIAGAAMMPQSFSIMPILYSNHSTSGKGTFVDLVSKMIGYENRGQVDQSKFFSNSSNFSLSSIKGKLLATMDELPHQLDSKATEKIKEYVDSKKFLFIERKGSNAEEILNTTTFITTTNKMVNIHNIDDAIKRRIIFVMCQMNEIGKPIYTKKEIDAIFNDDEGMEWFTREAARAIFRVIDRDGIRNERFTQPQDSIKYWNHVDSGSIAIEIIESDKTLSMFLDSQQEFWPNEDIKEAVINYKMKNPDDKITLNGFKREMMNHFSSKKIGSIVEKRVAGARGIEITWYDKLEAVGKLENFDEDEIKELEDDLF